MSIDKITQFELGIIELNRNIAYNEKERISDNYHQLNELYEEIVKLDIPLEQKKAMYNSVLETHENIQEMGKSKIWGARKIAGVAVAALLAGFFLFEGPAATGMAISGSTIVSSVTRFAPVGILTAALIFLFIKQKKKE
ncbi:MAG: hypothetical protein KAQ83_04065 [Nanoarchaeota archaeon]|nr:hypothetical protein [Nanoarchaeota archaeon]